MIVVAGVPGWEVVEHRLEPDFPLEAATEGGGDEALLSCSPTSFWPKCPPHGNGRAPRFGRYDVRGDSIFRTLQGNALDSTGLRGEAAPQRQLIIQPCLLIPMIHAVGNGLYPLLRKTM